MSTTVTDKPPTLDFPAPLGTEGKPPPPPNDTAPKKRGRPPGSPNKSTLSLTRIEEGLGEQFTLIGVAVMAFNEYDGSVIVEGAPRMSKAIANLCEKNPKVKRNVERMLAGGSYGEVIIAAGLIAIPIMANHNLMPDGIRLMYGQAIPTTEEATASVNGHRESEPIAG